jgi:hypothetical protein
MGGMLMNETKLQNERFEKRKLFAYSALMLTCFVLYILFVCLNNIFSSDIRFAGMMLIEITELLYLSVEIIAFFIAYAFVIYAMYMGGHRNTTRYAVVYAIAISARYVILFALDWLFFGLKSSDVPVALLFMLVNIFLELLQYVIVWVIAYINVNTFNKYVTIMQKGAARLKEAPVDREKLIFPYRKILMKNDPLRFSALLVALLMGVIRIIGRVIYDIGYGAPTDLIDILWMILYYSLDVFIGVACYFVLLYILRKLILSKEN